MKFDNILQTIGKTPVVRVNKLAPPHVKLYVKVEAFNPMGSVKDRLALGVIEDAERRGALRPGQTVIEATSGNTGIGLAMVCAQKGYPLVIVMAESFSVERRRLMRFLGAKVVLTPAHLRGVGMMQKTVELAEKHGWFFARQFENEANADMHSRTTAEEIIADFTDERLDYWVTGYGTGGTLKGVARVLRARSPKTQICLCEADNSPVLRSGVPDTPGASHPMARPHPLQGWGPDFVPKLTADAVEQKLFDRIVPIDGGDALRLSRELAQKEGIFVGITAGGTFAGALEVARTAAQGSTILCMLPDTGERYLSTPLFTDIAAEMNEEERAIAASTPSAQFGAAAPAPPAAPAAEKIKVPAAPSVSPEAQKLVDDAIDDPQRPVVMFALQWCEFCWAVRKMFTAVGVEYRSVDIDSVPYQQDDLGGKVRAAVSVRSGMKTIPQVYVAGELIGGAVEALEAWKNGRIPALLKARGVAFDSTLQVEPKAFLPSWMAGR